MKIHGLLIAAGASRRLGRPKQLVPYRGRPLINHAVDLLQSVEIDGFTVVLGAHADEIKNALSPKVPILINERWSEGMGTTISFGVLSLDTDVDAVLIMLVDQYKTTNELLIRLINEFKKSDKELAVSRYGNDVHGPPAIFEKAYFDRLKCLEGDRGAGQLIKKELKKNLNKVLILNFEEGHLDVDHPEDIDKL